MTAAEEPTRTTRRYHSPARAEKATATRERIRSAAQTLFLRDGYARTSMTRIANEAAVAEKTVYLAFPTKAALLSEIIRVAIRGDDRDTPMRERPSWRAMLQSPDAEILRRFAEINAELLERAGRILALGEAAAVSDPQLAGPRDHGHQAQRHLCRQLATELRRRGLLAPGIEVPEATDILFALTGENVYLRLVSQDRWPQRRYAEWLERTLRCTILTGSDG